MIEEEAALHSCLGRIGPIAPVERAAGWQLLMRSWGSGGAAAVFRTGARTGSVSLDGHDPLVEAA